MDFQHHYFSLQCHLIFQESFENYDFWLKKHFWLLSMVIMFLWKLLTFYQKWLCQSVSSKKIIWYEMIWSNKMCIWYDITGGVQFYEMHYVNAWLKRSVFNLYFVCLGLEHYQEGYFRVFLIMFGPQTV